MTQKSATTNTAFMRAMTLVPTTLAGHRFWESDGAEKQNQTVHFCLPVGLSATDLIGKIVDVRVREAKTWYLRGEVEGEAEIEYLATVMYEVESAPGEGTAVAASLPLGGAP